MRKVRLRTLERITVEVLMIVSGQNVKRLLEFGRRGPRKMVHGAGRTAAFAGGSEPTLYTSPSRDPSVGYFLTCYKEFSSVTDHRRLMNVAILCQLSEHESRDVLPRYSGGSVRISAEKDLVLTRSRFVGEPGRPYDHPLEATAFDYLLLTVFVGVLISHHEWQEDPVVKETAVSPAVTGPDARDANQPAYAVFLHCTDEVCGTGREKGGGLRAARTQS